MLRILETCQNPSVCITWIQTLAVLLLFLKYQETYLSPSCWRYKKKMPLTVCHLSNPVPHGILRIWFYILRVVKIPAKIWCEFNSSDFCCLHNTTHAETFLSWMISCPWNCECLNVNCFAKKRGLFVLFPVASVVYVHRGLPNCLTCKSESLATLQFTIIT